ncbi:MAG TPA: D-alanyl-D-alanine carboxypeptidase family protein [Solirubrobacteraceae bacterium]|nr:D-alanyl-D-alanine carboxypeptidase family protein [Solirubrobacteraceae bacterium]
MTRRVAAAAAVFAAVLAAWGAAISPASAAVSPTPAPPHLAVRAAALIEESSGDQLYGRNESAELAIASTTKLMTALVTLQHAPLGRVFADPDYIPASEDSQIDLDPGERMSVRDLLTAMLLPSADDAAVDLAYNVGHGSVSRFLGMMNAQARVLNLTHTHYTTPSGLDTPGNHSSASDLVNLASYLLQHEPFFRNTVARTRAVLRTGNHVRAVVNLNDLVAHYSWINGVKTGHTLDAGYVLVASGTQNGMTLIDAVLGTSSEAARNSNALALLNWGFANFGMRTPVHAGAVLARPAITGGKPGAHARLLAASSYTHVFPKAEQVRLRVTAPAQVTGPMPKDARVGWVAVVGGHRVVARIPLLLAAELPQIKKAKSIASVMVVSVTLFGLLVAVGAAIGLTMFWREWARGTSGGRPRSTKPR